MEEILSVFESGVIDPATVEQIKTTGANIVHYAIFIAIAFFGFLLISALVKFLFKKDQINMAITSAIDIFFVYVAAVVIYCFGLKLSGFLVPLPFVAMAEDYLVIYPIFSASFAQICGEILDLLMIAFLVNLVNSLIPKCRHAIVWFLLRCLTVVASIAAIYGLDYLLSTFVPASIFLYAPVILLLVLVLLMILGSMKLLVGAVLTVVNPVLGILYTFFFNNFIGKALSKSILTTALLTGLIVALNSLGIYAVYIAPSALTTYIPLLLAVLLLWYIVGHLFNRKKKKDA